jgi:hypothetical protein
MSLMAEELPEPIVTVLIPFDRCTAALGGMAQALSTEDVDRVVFVDYRELGEPSHTAHVAALRDYITELDPIRFLIRHEPRGVLSEIWNLGAMVARVHAELEDGDHPWSLIIIDPAVMFEPGTIGELAHWVSDDADVAWCEAMPSAGARVGEPDGVLTTTGFDGRCFAIGHEAGTGVLLTSHEHLDRRTCALDFIASLDAEALVVRLSGRIR